MEICKREFYLIESPLEQCQFEEVLSWINLYDPVLAIPIQAEKGLL